MPRGKDRKIGDRKMGKMGCEKPLLRVGCKLCARKVLRIATTGTDENHWHMPIVDLH